MSLEFVSLNKIPPAELIGFSLNCEFPSSEPPSSLRAVSMSSAISESISNVSSAK